MSSLNLGHPDELIIELKENFMHGSYEYDNPSESFKRCTTLHFRNVRKQLKYGVYIIRQMDTKEILYIGKGGTIDSKGIFKYQDVPKRLKNVKERDTSADIWFKNLLQDKGPLFIEYIFLPKSMSPALVETTLLQAFLNQYGRLPYKNKSL